jgi:hypothetical protein
MQAGPSMSKGSAKGKKRAKKGKSLDITRQALVMDKSRSATVAYGSLQ